MAVPQAPCGPPPLLPSDSVTLRLTVRVDQSVQLLLDYGAKAVYAIVGRAIASGVGSNKVGAHHTGVAVAVSPARRARATSVEKVSAERKPY